MLISATHFFGRTHEQWLKWSLEDRRHSTNLDGKYNRKANLATMDYVPSKKGATTSLYYREFHKEILPGLARCPRSCIEAGVGAIGDGRRCGCLCDYHGGAIE